MKVGRVDWVLTIELQKKKSKLLLPEQCLCMKMHTACVCRRNSVGDGSLSVVTTKLLHDNQHVNIIKTLCIVKGGLPKRVL